MTERLLFVTGRLAKARLEAVLTASAPTPFDWTILDIGVKVAALMTEPILLSRLPRPLDAGRVVLPGRCRADLERLSAEFGANFERGPDEVKDLPACFGKSRRAAGPLGLRPRIFAEIVDASQMTTDAILRRAEALRAAGADVIDLGCLPDTPFPHLEEAVRALKSGGFAVSVDSADPDELGAARRPAPIFVLSLTEHSLDLAGRNRRPARAHPGCARRPRFAGRAPRRRRRGAESRPFSIRSSTPIISVRRVARAFPRLARAPARGRDDDGDREPDRAHRRRQRRDHCAAARPLLRARHRQRAHRSREPAHAADGRGARRDAPHDVRSVARPAACRKATAARCCRSTTARRSRTRPKRSRKPRGKSRTGTSGSRSPRTAYTSTTATDIASPRTPLRCSKNSASSRTERTPSISAPTHEGGNRLPARQALRAGRAARLGLRRRSADRGPDAAREAGHTLRAKQSEGRSCR